MSSGLWIRSVFFGALTAITLPAEAAQLRSGDALLTVRDGTILVAKGEQPVIELTSIRFNYEDSEEWNVTEANDEEVKLTARFPASVDFYRPADDVEPRVAELTVSVVDGGFRLHSSPSWGRQVTLVFSYKGDHFFGLSEPLQPDNRLSPDLTGSVITLEVNSEGASMRENFATAYSAFYMSSLGYGAFFDTFARGRYDFAINGENRIHHDTGELDWHLFFGADGTEIHRPYFSLIGPPKRIPVWGLGPVAWRDQNNGGSAEILSDIEHMNGLRIPVTAWFVDRPYSDGAHSWSQMNFNEKFADPDVWIRRIREEFGLEFMTWASVATFGDARFEKHLPGKHSYVDLSHPGSVEAYQRDLQSKQYVHGVRGHKIDRADEYFPVYEEWHDASVGPAERRNTYAFMSAKVHDDVLRATWGDDQVTFARAAIHRVQPYLSAVWGGDSRATWEGMQANFANAARCAFMGFPVWGSDVGGYLGEGRIPEELYIRWLQAGSMSGLFEIKLDGAGGRGRDRLPWSYGAELQDAFRSVCEDRMRWIPYLYSLARTCATTGPLMQPMAYRHLDDPETYGIWDQFYVGDAVLVAPVFKPGGQRSVYFPEGAWRDLDDPTRRYEGPVTTSVDAPMTKLPRFVKENSLYVTGRIYKGNERTWNDDDARLTIHATPGESGSHAGFTYIDLLDADQEKRIELGRTDRGVRVASPPIACDVTVYVTLDRAPSRVELNGKFVDVEYDSKTSKVSVNVGSGQPIELLVSD